MPVPTALPRRAAVAAGALVLLVGAAVTVPGAEAAPGGPGAKEDRGQQPTAQPLVFGHRGASAYRPEHTLASYDLAIRMGADVIEPDLVSTKDRVLVARHENDITGTTDVADHPEFADRKATKTIDGTPVVGWFTEDFTLTELKTLRTKERLPLVRQENTALDGRYTIPTLDEVLALAQQQSRRSGRTIGVAPETKHPTYFDGIGLSLEEPLVAALRSTKVAPTDTYVQSFEEANLRELAGVLHPAVQVVQLTSSGTTARPYDHVVADDPQTYAQMTSKAGLVEVAQYADVLGPDKAQIFPRDAAGSSGAPSTLVPDAHAAGLAVVPYTVRAENQFLPLQYRTGADPDDYGDVLAELTDLFEAGVDGLFTDNPDLGFAAREDFLLDESVEHPQAGADS